MAKYAIYVIHNGEQMGPFTKVELRRQIALGKLSYEDYAWHDGFPEWILLSEIVPPLTQERDEMRWRRDPATDAQINYLISLGISDLPKYLTKGDASSLIEAARAVGNYATDNQKRRLYFYNIPVANDLTKWEATQLIDAYIKEHPESEEQYQEWKARVVGDNDTDLVRKKIQEYKNDPEEFSIQPTTEAYIATKKPLKKQTRNSEISAMWTAFLTVVVIAIIIAIIIFSNQK